MKSTSRTRPRKLELTMMAAIAAIAVLALPSLATAHGHRHHRHARHLSGWISETVPNQTATTGDTPATGQDNAGTIASFDGTTLKITLNDGSTLAGQVTSSTEIECSQSTTQQGTNDGQEGDSAEASDSPSQPGSQTESQDQGEQSDSQDQSSGDQSESDGSSGDSSSCTTAALVPGAVVHEAELEIGPNGAVFHSVHLAG